MRRTDREITDFADIVSVMEQCDVCRLALRDEPFPYILPLNFGMEITDGKVHLYFHSADEGTKLDLIRKDNRAAFEMDCKHELEYDRERGFCTYYFDSVIGQGQIAFVEEPEEKERALTLLMAHYHPGQDCPFNAAALPRTAVYRLDIEHLTGKRKGKK